MLYLPAPDKTRYIGRKWPFEEPKRIDGIFKPIGKPTQIRSTSIFIPKCGKCQMPEIICMCDLFDSLFGA